MTKHIARIVLFLVAASLSGMPVLASDETRAALFQALNAEDPYALDAVIETGGLSPKTEALAQGASHSQRLQLEKAIPLLETAGTASDPLIQRWSHIYLSTVHFHKGNYRRSAEAMKEALAIPDPSEPAGITEQNRQALDFAEALADSPAQTRSPLRLGELPITRDVAGLANASVTINGLERSFLLDTGAAISAMSHSTAKDLGVTLVGEPLTIGGASVSDVPAQAGVAETLDIGPVSFRNVVFAVFPDEMLVLADGRLRIDGIIGMPVFIALERIAFVRTGGTEIFRFGPSSLNRQGPEDLFVPVLQPVVYARADDIERPLRFVLDSGASRTYLFALALADFPVLADGAVRRDIRIEGVGGSRTRSGRVIPSMRLSIDDRPVTLRNVQVVDTIAHLRHHGLMGQNVLRARGGYILDFKTRDFRLVN